MASNRSNPSAASPLPISNPKAGKNQPKEYGFWANVNPEFDHPRWSQKTERLLGSGERVPTQKYNGYGEWVAGLYADMPQDRTLFFRFRSSGSGGYLPLR